MTTTEQTTAISARFKAKKAKEKEEKLLEEIKSKHVAETLQKDVKLFEIEEEKQNIDAVKKAELTTTAIRVKKRGKKYQEITTKKASVANSLADFDVDSLKETANTVYSKRGPRVTGKGKGGPKIKDIEDAVSKGPRVTGKGKGGPKIKDQDDDIKGPRVTGKGKGGPKTR